MMLLAFSELPQSAIGLIAFVSSGFLLALRGNHVIFDKHFTALAEKSSRDIDKVMKTHERVTDKLAAGLGDVRESVDNLGDKLDRHGNKIKDLIRHVKGEVDDDSDG